MKKLWMMVWLLIAFPAGASELDLYLGGEQTVPTRIMLLLDTSDSMSMTLGGWGYMGDFAGDCNDLLNRNRKICILKDTLSEFIDAGTDPDNAETRWSDRAEVGLARYGEPGAVILADVHRLDAVYELNGVNQSHRQHLQDALDNMALHGWTPLVGSYFETIQYLVGGEAVSQESVDHSVNADEDNDGDGDLWAAPGQYVGEGLDAECEANNHILVLTDGESTNERMSAAPQNIVGSYTLGQRINRFVTGTDTSHYHALCDAGINASSTDPGSRPTPTGYWGCTRILAQKLLNLTLADGETTTIKTHTVAYNLGDGPGTELAAWAAAGDGLSRQANSADELRQALRDIGEEIQRLNTFTATVPGVGINQANRFTHLDELYFSVFQPSNRAFWYGNLKQYKLGVDGDALAIFGKAYAGSSASQNADSDSGSDGFFDTDVFDLWFRSSDYPATTYTDIATTGGDVVHFGGAASHIVPALGTGPGGADGRNLYTTNGTNTVNLAVPSQRAALKTAVLGAAPSAPDSTAYDRFLNWLRGTDAADTHNEWQHLTAAWNKDVIVNKTSRTLYGAPIHSAPVLVNYTSMHLVDGKNEVLDVDDQENLVFVSTNDGKLYAVDAETGDEKLSFMPEVFLERTSPGVRSTAERMHEAARNGSIGDLIYGLDSTWTVWRQDMNRDGNITAGASHDFVRLFGGMRRGGRNYYGLDMTEAWSGQMSQLFVLEGGTAGTAFANLGQTWSEPVLALIKYNGVNQVVFIVAGGYDPLYDGGRPASGMTPMGNAIYIIKAYGANVGDVLWWTSGSTASEPGNHVSNTALTDSIPSTVKTLDKDGDGFVDHFYVGDLGGQIHRFDIQQTSATTTSINHDLVAQLGRRGGSDDAEEDRRFFYPPSIALMQQNGSRYVGIAIGSGLLTSPQDETVDERFYFIKDREPLSATAETPLKHETGSTAALVELQVLEDDGSAVSGSPSAPTAEQLAAARGYSAPLLMTAEKFLGSPLIIQNRVVFTTYSSEQPEDADNTDDNCVARTGSAGVYTYLPGEAASTQQRVHQPQALAGNIALLYPSLTSAGGDGDGDAELRDIQGWGGGPSGAIDLPDLDMSNVRKTRWIQCRTTDCL